MLEELKVIIKAETDKFKKNVEDAEKQTKTFKEQVAEAGKTVEEDLAGAGEKISSGLKVGMTALAAAGAALLALGASTAEYRNEQAKLQTAFEAAGGSAETAKSTYNDLFRVMGDTGAATEAAQMLAQLTTNEKDLAEWTNICQGVYAEMGSTIPIESLTEAVNETAKVGQVTGGLADAINWAKASNEDWQGALSGNQAALNAFNGALADGANKEDAFNAALAACNSEAEREKLLRETLNGLYGDAAAKFEENNAAIIAQNEAQAKLNDAMAALGEVTAPIMTMLTDLGADILTAITPYLQDFAENYLPVIKEVLSEIGTHLSNAIGWLTEHQGLLAAIAIVIGTVVTAIGLYNAVAAVKAAMDAAQVTTIWGLVAAHTAQAAAAMVALAPYILIVAAIAAVIAIIVLCIKHWDEIAAAAGKAWDWIKGVWEKVATWINEKVVQPIVNFFSGLWTKITEIFGVIKDWFSEKFTQAWEGIKNAWSAVGDWFKGIWDKVTGIFGSVKDWFKEKFQDAWEAIKGVFSSFSSFFSNLWGNIKNTFSALGAKIGDAIGGAVKSGINKVIDWIENTINKAINLINGAIGLINKLPGVNVGKLNKLSLPRLAKGGIVDSATIALIGEQGKEAVVPLENNTEWIDMLAAKLGGTGGAPIVLQVDGKTFAEISVSSINQLTRQRGSLPLVMA